MVPDLANNRYYMPSEATGTHGISQFTGLLSGACTLQKTQAQLGIGAFQDFPMCLTYSGNLITPAGNGSNSIELAQFRAADLTLISTAFSSSSTLAPSSATHPAGLIANGADSFWTHGRYFVHAIRFPYWRSGAFDRAWAWAW